MFNGSERESEKDGCLSTKKIQIIYFQRKKASRSYLTVEPDRKDIARVAVVADFCPFLEMIDVHLLWLRSTYHHHQTAGEEALHNENIWHFIWIKG